VEFLAMIDKYRAGVVTFEPFVEFSAGKEEAMAMASASTQPPKYKLDKEAFQTYFTNHIYPRLSLESEV
jgi:hypothetical protein